MQFFDALALDAGSVRLTRDGYLVAEARIARTGIQEYRASELGLTDRDPGDVIRVYRPADEVFAPAAMASMAHRPMTMDHPAEPVTAANWKRLAIGQTGGDVTRDGETIRVPLTLMDAAAIADVQAGKRQLSVGYSCELVFEDGVTPEGETYDAKQKAIAANHVAVCSVARGGPALRIGDRRETIEPIDGGPIVATKTITFDGLPLEVTDAAEAAIGKLLTQLKDANAAKATVETQVATLTTDKAALEAKVVTLEQAVTDAKLTPAQLRDAAKAYASVVDKAKALGVTVSDEMDTATIQRAAVDAKLGDAAKGWTDAQIAASFASLATDAKAPQFHDAARAAIANGTAGAVNTASIRDAARFARAN